MFCLGCVVVLGIEVCVRVGCVCVCVWWVWCGVCM